MTVYQARTLENGCSLKTRVRQMLACLTINYTPAVIEYFDSQVGIFTRFCKGRKGIWAFLENFISAPLKVISAGTKWPRQEVEESSCAPNKHKDICFQRFELEHKD